MAILYKLNALLLAVCAVYWVHTAEWTWAAASFAFEIISVSTAVMAEINKKR